MRPTLMKYNPAFLSEEELIHSFVVRQVDLELIIETIKENTGSSNQHILIIGPRGMGKTMLALRAAAYITNDKDLNKMWYPLVFSEESYEVWTAAEFWLRAVFHLGKQTGAENLVRLHDQLKEEKDEKRLYERALACLMDFADEQKKRLLLVVENLNMLLDEQIGSDESWDIRHTLLNEPRIMLLATATSHFDEIDNSGRAMFDLFKIHYLEPLNTMDSKCLWESLTGQEVEEERIRPIQILTGGNPRLLAIISSFAAGASFRELMDHLTSLIDEYTTYFKSNIESLPSLERKIFVTLTNIWEPATAARVGQDARINVNKVSSLLKRLEFRGVVSFIKSTGGKKSYQVTERLYNIYHLMRISGRQSDRVRAVVDFMVNFYEGKELATKMAQLTEEACCLEPEERRDHLEAYKITLQAVQEYRGFKEILYSTKQEFFSLPDVSKSLDGMISKFQWMDGAAINRYKQEPIIDYEKDTEESLEKDILETPRDRNLWLKYGLLLQEVSKKYNEAEKAFRKALEIDPGYGWAWFQLGALLHYELERYEEAEAAYRKAIEINPKHEQPWTYLGILLHLLKRYEEEEAAYRKAIEINPKYDLAWEQLGDLHYSLERYEEAEAAYRKVIEINPEYGWTWGQLGDLLHYSLERYEEAEAFYRKAIEINLKNCAAWFHLGDLLHEKLERYDDAEQAYRKAIEINPKDEDCWIRLGTLLHFKLERYEEAEAAFRKAIEINPKNEWAWNCLGCLLHYSLERYQEAETVYRKAIEINPKNYAVWLLLGDLLHEKLERYNEAEKAYRKAIEIGPKFFRAWAYLGVLLHENLDRYDEAEQAYRSALEIEPENAWAWGELGELLDEKLKRYEEAEEAYRNAIKIEPEYGWAWAQLVKIQMEQSITFDQVSDTISQYLKIDNRSAESLNNIVWLIFETDFKAGFSMAENLAQEAVEKEPESMYYQYAYASILGAQGEWEKALSIAPDFLKNPEAGKEYSNDIISFFIDAASAGYPAESSKLLKDSACAPYVEPLIVAMQMLTGEEFNAPQEVVEVAKDVVKRIEEKKQKNPYPLQKIRNPKHEIRNKFK